MKRTGYLLLVLLVFLLQGKSQQLPEGNWHLFDADVLGYIYACDGEQLIKTNTQGAELSSYQNSYLGDIAQIDCYKGLVNLVYHKNAGTVILLDNQLAPLGEPVDLAEGGFFDVAAVCTGTDDRLWIADGQSGKLYLIDKNFQVVRQGAVFRQYTNSQKIVNMTWRKSRLFIITGAAEVLIFDEFGTFSNRFSFININQPFLTNRYIYYFKKTHLFQFDYITRMNDTLQLVGAQARAVVESNNQLYLIKNDRIQPLNP